MLRTPSTHFFFFHFFSHNSQAKVEPVKKIILIFGKQLRHTGILSHYTTWPGGEHDSSSKVAGKAKTTSVLLIEQSVTTQQLWGTIQWLWQCNLEHTWGYSLALIVHNTLSLCSMVDGWQLSQENTNIDNDIISPSSCPNPPSAGTNDISTGTALLGHCNVETESFYLTNSYTQSEGKNRTASCTPFPPLDEERWSEEQPGENSCSTPLVVRLYCTPLVRLCRGRNSVSTFFCPIWSLY